MAAKEEMKSIQDCVDENTKTGSRVLALAYRQLNEMEIDAIDVETEEFFFRNLEFAGLLNFNNAIKPGVSDTIKELSEAGITNAIISGDNEYSCAFVAFKTGIIDPFATLHFISYNIISREMSIKAIRFIGDRLLIDEVDYSENEVFEYLFKLSNEEGNETHLSQLTLDHSHTLISCENSKAIFPEGKDFHLMMNNQALDFMKRKNCLDGAIISRTKVYARMTPSTKSDILELFKKYMGPHHKVGFMGDGSNDVRAMKIADVGISFYGCEASISAGFCVPFNDFPFLIHVITEGKGCLEVCIELFKFICFYSLGQFMASFILDFYNIDLSNGMYYIMDLFIIVPCSISMCFHGAEKLVKSYPLSSLFCKPIVLSVIAQGLVIGISMLSGSLYLYNKIPDNSYLPNSNIGTLIFMLLTCDFVFISVLIVRGGPFRKSKFTNYFYSGHLVFCLIMMLYFVFINSFQLLQPMNDWFVKILEV